MNARAPAQPAPLQTRVAVVLVDVINAFDFEGSDALIRAAKRVAPAIDALAERARAAGVPVMYVNDNFGRWRSDFAATVEACRAPGKPGRSVVERLRPKEGDYFVLKPQHSGFYSTTLELLLRHLGTRTLVLAGFATNLCVEFTANDAHMRGYHLVVPRDCTASNTRALTRAALVHVASGLHGDTPLSKDVDFDALSRRKMKPRGQPFGDVPHAVGAAAGGPAGAEQEETSRSGKAGDSYDRRAPRPKPRPSRRPRASP